jgi:hypothetical protein
MRVQFKKAEILQISERYITNQETPENWGNAKIASLGCAII